MSRCDSSTLFPKYVSRRQKKSGSRGSSSSQVRGSQLSTRVSRRNAKRSTSKPQAPPFEFPLNSSDTPVPTAEVVSTLTVLEQVMVQVFKGKSYVGACLASVSLLPSSNPAAPSLVLEDSKGTLQWEVPVNAAVLEQDFKRPQYLHVKLPSQPGETARWTLMFQSQLKASKFIACAMASQAVSEDRISLRSDATQPVVVFECPSRNEEETKAQRWSEAHLTYTVWKLEGSTLPSISVGEVIEEVTKDTNCRCVIGEGQWVRGLEDALIGMTAGSSRIVYYQTEASGSARQQPTQKGRRGVRCIAWVSCAYVASPIIPPPPAPSELQRSPHRLSTYSYSTTTTNTTTDDPTHPQNVQSTLATIQKQIAFLQLSMQCNNTAMDDDGDLSPLGATAMQMDLHDSDAARPRSPVAKRCSSSSNGAPKAIGARSVKRLCNDIYQEVETALQSVFTSCRKDQCISNQDVQNLILGTVADCIHKCGEQHLTQPASDACARSPIPAAPKIIREDYETPLKNWERNALDHCGKSSAAGSYTRDDRETSGSLFQTPPPRAAVLLGSQDYRGSPTPTPTPTPTRY